jgi:hypothetical protein
VADDFSRLSQPIARSGDTHDRPFDLDRHDRIEAARGGAGRQAPRRQPRRQSPSPSAPGDTDDDRQVGRHLDTRA